ncbi:MAG: hypothetical protein KAR79_02585 [Simkaniaceae bacterium]|nr:hypothetical protein [Simkaniaceae bacterium]
MTQYLDPTFTTVQLERLQPYIYYLMDHPTGNLQTAVGRLSIVAISDTQGAFTIDGDDANELLGKIHTLCIDALHHKLVVLDRGGIRHRYLYFELNKDSQMIVSSEKNFEDTMKEIQKMFPEVRLGG